MVKVSKAPLVAVQDRLKLSGVMLETFKFPISGSPAEKKRGGGRKEETNKFELIICLCFKVEVVNRTAVGKKDLIHEGYGEMQQCYQSAPMREGRGGC